jgi:hypothetical protein
MQVAPRFPVLTAESGAFFVTRRVNILFICGTTVVMLALTSFTTKAGLRDAAELCSSVSRI